jgi:hypothetical protein
MSSFNRYFKKFHEFDSKLINFKEFKESKGKNKALISYPSNGEFKFQTPDVEYTTRGFPPKVEDEPDRDRNYFQIPLDVENKEHKILIDKMNELDEYLNSEDIRKQLWDKNVKKYTSWKVKPTVRNLDEEGKVPFMKANFDVDYNDNKIKTIVFVKNDGEVTEVPTSEYCNSIDDLIKIVPYRSVICFQLIISKIWTMASSKEYGVGFKINKIVVQAPYSDNNDTKGYDFISDEKVIVKTTKNLKVTDIDTSDEENLKTANDSDEENLKTTNADDSDEEIVVKKQTTTTKSYASTKEIAEIESSDDDEVVVKKPVKKQVDSDDEVVVKKPVKKQVDSDDEEEIIRPSKALADNDSDNSDDEVIKPKNKIIKEEEKKKITRGKK